jgi:hypothetical protein
MANVGIVHVHSSYSYDGESTLEEIALLAKRRGYSFIGMTEHSDTFDEDKMRRFTDGCKRFSDSSLLMIPGIEFTCEGNLHLLGVGVREFTPVKDPIAVAKFINRQGGIAIVSHPSRYEYKLPPGLEMEIHGIEIWNAAYDGRFVPNDRSIVLWQALRRRNRTLCPFGGQDLHQITDHSHVKIRVLCDEPSEEQILRSLKASNYEIANYCFRLRPASLGDWHKLAPIACLRRAYIQAKSIRDRVSV